MSDANEPVRLDQRIQDYLDGELSASEAAAFEAELRTDAGLGNRVAALRGMAIWFRSTRDAAPSSLASTVERALEAERASTADASPAAEPLRLIADPPSGPSRRPWARVVGGLAAAAVLGLLLLNFADRTPRATRGPSVSPSETALVRYTFQYRAPDAGQICLAGDFNNWKVCESELTHVGEDLWTIALELPRGRHEYMFVVDGQWRTDPGAMLFSDDGFGNKNAVINL